MTQERNLFVSMMNDEKKTITLGIETSCDETAISIIETTGSLETGLKIAVLSNVVISQIEIHKPYGGVFPALAKREHAKNLAPILIKALKESKLFIPRSTEQELKVKDGGLQKLLEREPELLASLQELLPTIKTPKIDALAVTHGPGLEPALWVGINFAKALSLAWEKPVIPVNHMEGHIFSAFLNRKEFSRTTDRFNLQLPNTPALALLISGGHTEIVLIKKLFRYKVIGETRDDAVGEAFDKAARILGLPYPGGPEISLRAEKFRGEGRVASGLYKLPRPMIHSEDFDFSFSGIKTAVLYMVRKIENCTENIREEICYEFEEAVTETLVSKTLRAAGKYRPKSIIMGGGVTANIHIQKTFKETFVKKFPDVKILVPTKDLSTDNALMIALAGNARAIHDPKKILMPNGRKMKALRADGNLRLLTQ